jgi:hypothetical protein
MAKLSRNFSDPNLLEAALEGLLLQKQRIEAQIQEVKGLLGRRRAPAQAAAAEPSRPASRKRELSDAARKRIAAAQKKRWAEYRKKQNQ